MPTYQTSLSRTSTEEVQYLLSRTNKEVNGCLIWNGAVNSDGYPKLSRRYNDKDVVSSNVKGHRHLYEHFNGITLSSDVVVRHTCDNPLCINPDHLIIGSSQDNVSDRVSRGRSYNAVSPEEVKRVKDAVSSCRFKTEAAKLLGLPYKRLCYVLKEH